MDINNIITSHLKVIKTLENQQKLISETGKKLSEVIKNGKKIFFMGNGGSAADSQHLAAELIGRFNKERVSVPAIALTTDTSILTAVGNDYSYDHIFTRQIQGLCSSGDAVVGLSTSGNSKNVENAMNEAKLKGALTVALSGKDGGLLKKIADISIIVDSDVTARIQEAHILIGHIICEIIEEDICG
jgi:D-sedoheptulose 7-phosphate isomerase